MFLFPTIYSKFVFFFFFFFFFFFDQASKNSWVFQESFCFVEKNHMVYMEKKENFVPTQRRNYNFLHGLYGGKRFSKIFCAILTKSMEFLSSLVFHTVLWTTVFHPILLFLLNKILLVIVWNNLNINSVEY